MAEFCSVEIKLIYACSGSADIGENADRVTRKQRDEACSHISYILTDMGLVKGETPVTKTLIAQICEKIKTTISRRQCR